MLTISDIVEDILFAMLDGLHADGPALRACAHTARVCRLPFQELLFLKMGSITFNDVSTQPPPHGASGPSMASSPLTHTSPRACRTSTTCVNPSLRGRRGVLRMSTHVHMLSVTVPPQHWHWNRGLKWEMLQGDLRGALGWLLRRPLLQRVHLCGIVALPEENLPRPESLFDMSLQKVTVELGARSASVMPLRSFSFEILKAQADVETCRAVIRMSAATLKQLRFTVKESSERHPVPLDILNLSPLQTLASLGVTYFSALYQSTLARLSTFLNTYKRKDTTLKEFSIRFKIKMDETDWQYIDRILSRPACLSKANIHVHLSAIDGTPVGDALQEVIEMRFPRLAKREVGGALIYMRDWFGHVGGGSEDCQACV